MVSERHPNKNGYALGVLFRFGSKGEPDRLAGLAHFLEHMFFKGTKGRSAEAIVREIESTGGEINAFTEREYTCYHVTGLKTDLARGADVLCDILLYSTFPPAEIDRERKVILQEIAATEENPEELVFDAFFERAFGRRGLGTRILGTAQTLKRIKRRNLIEATHRYYSPDQWVVSVAGNVKHETLVARLRSLIPVSRRRKGRKAPPHSNSVFRAGRWWAIQNSEQAHMVVGFQSPKLSTRERLAAGLLNVYLGSGMSSVLFQDVREKSGLAYSVYTYFFPFTELGVFTVYAATNPSQVNVCLSIIAQSLARTTQELMTEDMLDAVKTNLKGNILLTADDLESRMLSIGRNEVFYSHYLSPEEVCDMIDELTPQEIRRVARKLKLADFSQSAVMVVSPDSRARAAFSRSR